MNNFSRKIARMLVIPAVLACCSSFPVSASKEKISEENKQTSKLSTAKKVGICSVAAVAVVALTKTIIKSVNNKTHSEKSQQLEQFPGEKSQQLEQFPGEKSQQLKQFPGKKVVDHPVDLKGEPNEMLLNLLAGKKHNEDIIKITLIGSRESGKTALCEYLTKFPITSEYRPTIGHNVYESDEVENVKCQLWSTGGNELYRSLLPIYVRNSEIVLIVERSVDYNNIVKRVREFLEVCDTSSHVVYQQRVIVINTFGDAGWNNNKKELIFEELHKEYPELQVFFMGDLNEKSGANS